MSPYIWLGLMVLFLVVEIITLGLTSIWFAGGACISFFLNLMNLNNSIQIVAFFLVSLVLVSLVRPIAEKKFNNRTVKTNVDGLIGEQARVIESISNIDATGRVVINGMEWTARANSPNDVLEKDAIVKVVRIEGVKVIVE